MIKYRLKLLPIWLLCMATVFGCSDEAENPGFDNDAIPRIFDWAGTYAFNVGEEFDIDLRVSPSDNASFEWAIEGNPVSTEKQLNYKFDSAGEYNVKFTVVRNGVENTRAGKLLVTKPFVAKTYNKKVVGFLTRAGKLENVDFEHLTHLVVSSAVVKDVDDGSSLVDTTLTDINIPLLTKVAHNYGVYVLLDVTGTMVDVNGGGVYGDYGFYNVIADETKRDLAIQTFLKFAQDNEFDGVNIYLNNTSEGPDALDADVVGAFYKAVAESMPSIEESINGKFFYTASVPGGWTSTALAPLVNTIDQIDWVNIQPYRNEDLTPVDHASLYAFTTLAETWIGQGVPAEKIVGGFPAFGLKYDIPSEDEGIEVNWGNLWQFTAYMPYKSVLQVDATANAKSYLGVDKGTYTHKHENNGIYYDGQDKVALKGNTVLENGYGGLMVWSLENDAAAVDKSLLKTAYESLKN